MSFGDLVSVVYDECGVMVALFIETDPGPMISHGYEVKLNRAQFIALCDAITDGLVRGEDVG